jgi:hypothetical protein
MTIVNGHTHDWWNSRGMLFAEATLCVAGAVVFVLIARQLLPRKA